MSPIFECIQYMRIMPFDQCPRPMHKPVTFVNWMRDERMQWPHYWQHRSLLAIQRQSLISILKKIVRIYAYAMLQMLQEPHMYAQIPMRINSIKICDTTFRQMFLMHYCFVGPLYQPMCPIRPLIRRLTYFYNFRLTSNSFESFSRNIRILLNWFTEFGIFSILAFVYYHWFVFRVFIASNFIPFVVHLQSFYFEDTLFFRNIFLQMNTNNVCGQAPSIQIHELHSHWKKPD